MIKYKTCDIFSLQTDGRITNVEVFGYQKRYNPEKYYVSQHTTCIKNSVGEVTCSVKTLGIAI